MVYLELVIQAVSITQSACINVNCPMLAVTLSGVSIGRVMIEKMCTFVLQ